MPSKTASAAVFAALWNDAKYLRLHERKDAAIRAAHLADFYKTDAAKANRAVKRALRALQAYEDRALAAAR